MFVILAFDMLEKKIDDPNFDLSQDSVPKKLQVANLNDALIRRQIFI